MSDPRTRRTPERRPGLFARVADPAQFGVVAGLLAIACYVLVDTARLHTTLAGNDPVGPRPVPVLLAIGVLVVAVAYTVDILRGGSGEQEAGEDIDAKSRIDWRTLGLLAAAFVINALLIERAGWVISSTILFWLSAYALGNRHHLRGLLIGVALALGTFYAFAVGLGVNLPAGVLKGIL